MKLMVFDFDIMYVKENATPREDALSRQEFVREKAEKYENAKDKSTK